jgi:hypothetical protein
MALELKDRVLETASAPGTGTVTLLGASLGYQSFNTALTSGNTTYYAIADLGGANWEVGIGTFTSPNQLARNTILESSSGGSAVNFSSGTQNVFITYPAEKSVNLDASNNVSPLGTIASGTWNATAIVTTYGGTGLTSYTAGDLPYYATGTALSKLGIGTNGYILTSNGTAPTWAANTAATPDDAYFLSFMMG